MRILVACEFSGTVRDAFIRRGHDAWSCDLLPTEKPGPHFQANVINVLWNNKFDMMIAHPPCTYLCRAGVAWNGRRPERIQETEDALEFVRFLLNADVERICLENPPGMIGVRIRPCTQTIQPYEFGHNASKATSLWLKNLPPLNPTQYIRPRYVDGLPRWANQDDKGGSKVPESKNRWKIRAKTYRGIAEAMAEQWSNL